MSGRARLLIVASILAMVAVGAGAALAAGGDGGGGNPPSVGGDATESPHPGDVAEDEAEGPDRPIDGPDLERASNVALDYLGGGRVTGTEVDDEESYYEIEVTRDDGAQVDVQLDESFKVVGTD